MDFNETVKKTMQVPRVPYLEDLVHVRKANYLLTTMHNYSVPINGKIRVQITQVQPNSESTEIPSTPRQGLWINLGGWGFISLR